MSCLLHLFHRPRPSQPSCPRLPPSPPYPSPKPTFCIYDSEEEGGEHIKDMQEVKLTSPFPLLDSFSLPHPSSPPQLSLLHRITVTYTTEEETGDSTHTPKPPTPSTPSTPSTPRLSLPSISSSLSNRQLESPVSPSLPPLHLHLHQ